MCTAFLVIRQTKQLLLWKKKLQKRSPSKFITVLALSGHPKNVRKHFTAEKPPYLLHNEQPIHVQGFPALQISLSPSTPYKALPLFYGNDKDIIWSIDTAQLFMQHKLPLMNHLSQNLMHPRQDASTGANPRNLSPTKCRSKQEKAQ